MLKTMIQDIEKGDTFEVNGVMLEAQDNSHKNFDEEDEPWIVYDTNGNSWFEEDIND